METDFLFCKLIAFYSVNIPSNEAFLKNGQNPVLTVMSAGHAMHVFINGQPSGRQNWEKKCTLVYSLLF